MGRIRVFLGHLVGIFHPFLFALYPVVSLLANNAGQVNGKDALRPLLLSLAGSSLIYFLLWLLLRNQPKAALITSLGLILFYSYGQVYFWTKPLPVLGKILGRQSILALLWLVLFGLGALWILGTKADLLLPGKFLNIISAVTLAIPGASYGVYTLRSIHPVDEVEKIAPVLYPLKKPAGKPLPDIYYIILDEYARDDVLATTFQYNNQPFLNQLKGMGFTVLPCNQSNYTQTELSLASSLNMNYLSSLDPRYTAGYEDRTGLPALIDHSIVRRSLSALGYRTATFQNEYPFINLTDADLYFAISSNSLGYLQEGLGVNPFETLLLKTTAGLVLTSFGSPDKNYVTSVLDSPFKAHISQELFTLDKLADVTRYSGPKFVLVDILIPHGPMVFGADGPLNPKDFFAVDEDSDLKTPAFLTAYRSQTEFVNRRILPILQAILARSKTPPIIILQGDNGPWIQPETLNALYLPDGGGRGLYPTITPVNTFRLIFNTYFGASYPMLADKSYSTNDYDPFAENLYPNTRQDCGN